MTQTLKISVDFSDTPGPRYKTEGHYSGEEFRTEMLYPRLKEAIGKGDKLIIDLDGAQGYGTSFLEEAFGGLIRNDGLGYDDIIKHIEIVSEEEPYLIDDIQQYLKDADDETKKVS